MSDSSNRASEWRCVMKAAKNAHDWSCEAHGTYGWRGESCRQCPEAPAEIEELKRHLAVYEANEARFIAADKSMQAQLAESQARDARLREALNEAESALDECRDYPITYDAVLDALALPHDDTALKEYRDAVIEEFVGKFKRHVGGDGEFWMHELEDFYQNTKAP